MMQLGASLLVITSVALAAFLLASVIAAVARKWAVFRKCALAAAIAALGFAAGMGLIVFGAVSQPEPSSDSKATALAKGISDGMNTGVIVLPVVAVAIVCWLVAKRLRSRRGP